MLGMVSGYFFIGLIWVLIHELSSIELNNSERFRLWIFWPITVVAFIIGVIQFFMGRNNNE